MRCWFTGNKKERESSLGDKFFVSGVAYDLTRDARARV